MKPSTIKTIRRMALAGAVVMTLIVTVTYLNRRRSAEQARQEAATPIGEDVQQQAEKFTFSRSQEGQILFTVEADRTTERAGETTVLEDVVVRIYGQQGERNDEILTSRCEYDAGGTQLIVCPDEVTVLLLNPRAVSERADSMIRLTTAALQFDPERSVAWTEEPVRFSFPGGSGEAVGLRYQASEPKVQLQRRVAINVSRPGEDPVQITGARLDYRAGSRVFELASPLQVAVGSRSLVAERLRMELDSSFRTRRIEASGHARATASQDGRALSLTAARAVASYGSGGAIERLETGGGVEFEATGVRSRDHLACQDAAFHFDVPGGSVDTIEAAGDCALTSEAGGQTHLLRAPRLELQLQGIGPRARRLLARQGGALTLRDKNGSQRRITADELELGFSRRLLRQLSASGNTEWWESRAGERLRTSRSRELRARFSDQGNLAGLEQWGAFRYEDARWQAESGRAEYSAESGRLILREKPAVWDATSRTTAQRIEVGEATDELRASGEVRTTRRSTDAFGTGEPVHLAAERLRASEGAALYEGEARLWQGENRLAAETIRVSGEPDRLQAEGGVSAVFLEARQNVADGAQPQAVRVTAERFFYQETKHLAVFEQGVRAQSSFGVLNTPRLEVLLTGGAGEEAARVHRVRAEGGVRFEQGGIRATSEEGEYRPEDQVVLLWGGTPTIHHPQRGITTGARLTLHLADATLSIDSAEGIRTVTRRPWTQ
jgi:LPS export ABC transporter protein LptC